MKRSVTGPRSTCRCAYRATQLFLGIYAGNGRALLEEYYPARPGETMTRALVWGVERARALATGALPLPAMARTRRRA